MITNVKAKLKRNFSATHQCTNLNRVNLYNKVPLRHGLLHKYGAICICHPHVGIRNFHISPTYTLTGTNTAL